MVSFLTDEELRLRFEVEEFLYREADLLDEQRFEEWLDLFTEDARYYMPIRRNVPVDKRDNENTRERRDMSWFDESKETLRKRVAQIRTGVHWAEEPISRVSHIVSNVRILDTEPEELGMGEIKVRCRFVVYRNRLEDEVGDLLFVLVNIARYLSLDPESALRKTNRKFRRRFQWIEERLRERGRAMPQATLDEMESLWQESKQLEKTP